MLDGAFWDGARFGMPRRGGEEVVCTYPPTPSRAAVRARPLYGLVGVTSVCTYF